MQVNRSIGEQVFSEALLDIKKNEKKDDGSIFEFEPMPLAAFIKDKSFLGLPPLSPKQFDAVEVATQVYFPQTMKLLGWQKRKYVNELVLLWGKGSGKDYISRIIHLRVAYLLMALKNPQAYYFHKDMPVGVEPFHLLNTATTKEQAANIFFAPLRKMIQKSPFFRARGQVLVGQVKFEKSIYLVSGHSEAEAQEGMNLFIAILDEIAAFKTDEEVADIARLRLRKNMPQSANSIYDFAHSSRVTRFPRAGKVILLSFPRFKGDFITTKYDEGKKNSKVYTSFGSTFDVNPTKKLSDFDDEKKRNPVRYKCRILCQPGLAEDAFFRNEGAIQRAFKHELDDPVDHQTKRIKTTFRCEHNFLCYGHVDLAKNRDRAAFCLVHAYDVVEHEVPMEDEDKKIIQLPMIKTDILRYYEAPPGGEVNYNEIMDDITMLYDDRGFNLDLLTFDGYQSVQMMQTLEDRGIRVDNLSVDRTREPYESWQDALYDGRFVCYYSKILVEEEIPFLIDCKGKKIEHRREGAKDGADAVAGAVHNCIVEEGWGSMDVWHGGNNEQRKK